MRKVSNTDLERSHSATTRTSSRILCQMMRVISSPSISTTVPLTLILEAATIVLDANVRAALVVVVEGKEVLTNGKASDLLPAVRLDADRTDEEEVALVTMERAASLFAAAVADNDEKRVPASRKEAELPVARECMKGNSGACRGRMKGEKGLVQDCGGGAIYESRDARHTPTGWREIRRCFLSQCVLREARCAEP